jgi:predicted nucleic acid-binding Zn ribbon protein
MLFFIFSVDCSGDLCNVKIPVTCKFDEAQDLISSAAAELLNKPFYIFLDNAPFENFCKTTNIVKILIDTQKISVVGEPKAICMGCGTKYSGNSQYCSTACMLRDDGNDDLQETFFCPGCGVEYNGNSQFCSRQCMFANS